MKLILVLIFISPYLACTESRLPEASISFMSTKAHLSALEQYANEALDQYGLAEKGWIFRWDHARKRFGSCVYSKKWITMSIYLARINDINQCWDTILHEIAHALAGQKAGHGPAWRAACKRVGAEPKRCFDAKDVALPPSKYVRFCPSCDRVSSLHRRSRKSYACGDCCKKYNGGKFSSKYRLVVMERHAYQAQSE